MEKSKHPLYKMWRDIVMDCEFNNIILSPYWEKFEQFLHTVGEVKPFRGARIVRIDKRYGYSPENCQWDKY